jgi:hypothetical protein
MLGPDFARPQPGHGHHEREVGPGRGVRSPLLEGVLQVAGGMRFGSPRASEHLVLASDSESHGGFLRYLI